MVLAEAGLPLEAAATVLGETEQSLSEKTQEAHGVPWVTLLERARAKVRADLISSAIRAARLGDWKPYLSLEKAGIQLSLIEKDEEEAAGKRQPQTLAETEARIAELQRENAEKSKAGEVNPDLSSFEGVTLLE